MLCRRQGLVQKVMTVVIITKFCYAKVVFSLKTIRPTHCNGITGPIQKKKTKGKPKETNVYRVLEG